VPTISALRERGDEVVRRVLAENEGRWESLSDADRERLEKMAKAIASRLLHEPTLRIRNSACSGESYFFISALRELFGLEVETAPESESQSNVTELRRQQKKQG
jgi:glutamyl-tRNA reductase